MIEKTTESPHKKTDSQSFDRVAERYDTYRPSYPKEMIEDILRIADIQPNGKILEIGSGTGKATILFAQKGYAMLCLEPGQNLLDVAATNLAAYPQVRFVKARFEEWNNDQETFDLVVSAQAYHWVPENVRYQKTAGVLKYRGYLAAFWNMYPGMKGKIREDLDRIYRKNAPELVKDEIPIDALIESRANSLCTCPYFENVEVRKHPWSVRYSTSEYLGLLGTYSDHLRLPEKRRNRLFTNIAELINQNGGFIERPYLAVVYLAQRSFHT